MTIQLVQGDITPVIELTTDGLDLIGKTIEYWLTRSGSCEAIVLEAFLQPDGKIHVPLTYLATEKPGTYRGQLVIPGEQTVYDRQVIVIRSRCA